MTWRSWRGNGKGLAGARAGIGGFERKQIYGFPLHKDKNLWRGEGQAGQKKHKILGKEKNN